MMTVAFTGYRPEKMPFQENSQDRQYLAFRNTLFLVITDLVECGCKNFICGVAPGFDTWAAEDVLAMRASNQTLTLDCAIPFPGQADSWMFADQERRYRILTAANHSVITSRSYHCGCYSIRNRYMVDRADVVVCAYNGLRGGHCLQC